MKKAVVTAFGVLSVISILPVLPAIQGIRIESRIRDQIKALNETLGQDISIKIKHYERGWFQSRMRVACAIGSDGKNSWIAPVDVIHGPFPIVEIITGRMSPRFFDAQLESRFTPTISDSVVQRALAQNDEPLINLSATFAGNGSVRIAMTSPALSTADENFQWKGASISLASREKPRDIRIDARLAGFSLRNAKRKAQLKAGKMKWSLQASDSFASIESDLNIENFYREHTDFVFDIKKLKARVKTDRGRHKLHYGSGSASLDEMRIKAPKWGVDWTVGVFLLHASSRLVENKFDIATQGTTQKLVTPDMVVGPLRYSLAARELDPATFYLAATRLASGRKTDSSAKDQSSEKDPGERFHFVRSVLSEGSPRIEGMINVRNKAQRGKIGVHLIIDGKRAASIDSFRKLPEAATGNLNLRFSTGLFTKFWTTGAGVLATVTESKLLGDPARIESEAEMHISKLIKSKLILRKDDNYVSRFNLNRGTITVNRLPFEFLRILADVMAKDPTEVTVGFGKLGVRGGLQLSDVRGSISTLTKGLESCVQKELDNGHGHPRGVVHVKWKISDAGRSESPNIVYSTVVNDTLEACVISLFSPLRFPAAERKSRAILVIAFALPDLASPITGFKFGTLHHYKNPFPPGTTYTIGPASVER